jgi:hypothetical protein
MSRKPNPILTAKRLLEKNGYRVTPIRPDPQIGDIIRFWYADSTCDDVLITFHQTNDVTPEDVYDFGGVVVAQCTHRQMDTDNYWINRNEWQQDAGDYELVGHVDLSGFTLKHPAK